MCHLVFNYNCGISVVMLFVPVETGVNTRVYLLKSVMMS